MNHRLLALTAVLALGCAPAALGAATTAPAGREIELHIEAQGEIPPDRVAIVAPLTAYGVDRASAEADLAKKKKDLLAALAAKGIGSGQVSFGEMTDVEESAAMVEARQAAEEAAAAAADAAKPARRAKGKRDVEINPVGVGTTATVALEDIGKIEAARGAIKGVGIEMNNFLNKPSYSSSDPDKARRQARELAVSRARRDADEYAGAMGYHVVRLVRVSNARPVFNLPDMLALASTFDVASNATPPFMRGGTTYATVAIDYVIAPN